MTEQSDIWKVKVGSITRKCLKHGLLVTGCTLFYDCKDCIKTEKEPKDVPKEPNKQQEKPPIPNFSDSSPLKKRGKKSRNEPLCGPICNEKPVKIPKNRSNCGVHRRLTPTYQEKLIT